MVDNRKDFLTEQQVEVGLVFRDMLSIEDAEAYLRNAGVAEPVIARVCSAGEVGNFRPFKIALGVANQ